MGSDYSGKQHRHFHILIRRPMCLPTCHGKSNRTCKSSFGMTQESIYRRIRRSWFAAGLVVKSRILTFQKFLAIQATLQHKPQIFSLENILNTLFVCFSSRQFNFSAEGMLISVTYATLHEKARCFTCLKRSSNTCFPWDQNISSLLS